jgi:outer membrane protein
MNNSIKILSILFFFLVQSTFSFASENIRYINLDYIIQNTKLGKKILSNLENTKKDNLEKFKLKENELRSREQDIVNKKNILSKEEFDSKILKLSEDMNIYNSKKQKKIIEFETNKKNMIDNYLKQINPIIEDYVKKNSIEMVINKNNLFIASKKLDISNDIIQIIDDKLGK